MRSYAEAQGRELAWLVWGERRIVRDLMGFRDDPLGQVNQRYANIHRRVVSLEELRDPDATASSEVS